MTGPVATVLDRQSAPECAGRYCPVRIDRANAMIAALPIQAAEPRGHLAGPTLQNRR